MSENVRRLARLTYAVDDELRSIDLYNSVGTAWQDIGEHGQIRRLTNGTEITCTIHWRGNSEGESEGGYLKFIDCYAIVIVRFGRIGFITPNGAIEASVGQAVKIPRGAKWHEHWSKDAETITNYFAVPTGDEEQEEIRLL